MDQFSPNFRGLFRGAFYSREPSFSFVYIFSGYSIFQNVNLLLFFNNSLLHCHLNSLFHLTWIFLSSLLDLVEGEMCTHISQSLRVQNSVLMFRLCRPATDSAECKALVAVVRTTTLLIFSILTAGLMTHLYEYLRIKSEVWFLLRAISQVLAKCFIVNCCSK